MARYQVLISARGIAVSRNVRTSDEGMPRLVLDEGDDIDVAIDFAPYLETSETVSSATVSAENVTCTVAVATPVVTLSISSVQGMGDITLTVTMSSGEVWAGTFQTEERSYPSRRIRYA